VYYNEELVHKFKWSAKRSQFRFSNMQRSVATLVRIYHFSYGCKLLDWSLKKVFLFFGVTRIKFTLPTFKLRIIFKELFSRIFLRNRTQKLKNKFCKKYVKKIRKIDKVNSILFPFWATIIFLDSIKILKIKFL
jgi:hypothetical protein